MITRGGMGRDGAIVHSINERRRERNAGSFEGVPIIMNRLHNLIRYFVDHLPDAGRTKIVKYLYLADYEARRHTGKPISSLRYRWDNHGPFDPAILRALEDLRDRGEIAEEKVQFPNGCAGFEYRIRGAAPCGHGDFTLAERSILNTVVTAYGDKRLRELLEDVVYETEPMRDARERNAYGEPLRMELVDNTQRIPGLELEDMLQADEDLRAGKGIPLDEALAKREG